jgi:hypothetical protein
MDRQAVTAPVVGAAVDYVSPYRTGTFDAVIAAVHDAETVDLLVNIPGVRDPWPLKGVKLGPGQRAQPRP